MKCDYITCDNEATTSGIVFGKDKSNKEASLEPFPVNACDKHKTHNSFFEDVEK